MTITRREFTKKLGGLGAGSMIAFAGCGPREADKNLSETRPEKQSAVGQTKLRRLGKTDLVLSPVGFGAQRTRDADLIRYALDRGMNHIETAWSYGLGRPGNSCESIGEATIGNAPDHREALKWVLPKDYITAATPGMTTRSQVDLNLKIMGSTA